MSIQSKIREYTRRKDDASNYLKSQSNITEIILNMKAKLMDIDRLEASLN
jgi:hypothetical protein